MGGRRPAQVGQQRGVSSERQGQIVTVELSRHPLPTQIVAHGVQPRRVQREERRTSPQGERLLEEGRCRFVVPSSPRLNDQVAEAVQVDVQRIHRQEIAARLPRDPRSSAQQSRPKTRQVVVQGPACPQRRMIRPDTFDDPVDRHHAVGLHEQHRQHAPLPSMPNIHQGVIEPNLNLTEHPKQGCHLPPEFPRCNQPSCTPAPALTSQLQVHDSFPNARTPMVAAHGPQTAAVHRI